MKVKQNVIFFPGVRLNNDLSHFFELLHQDYHILRTSIIYDEDLAPYINSSKAQHSLKQQIKNISNTWWIGLSLGAVVAYVISSSIEPKYRPKRMTLINPFSDRVELLRDKSIPIGKYWPLQPILHQPPPNVHIDIIHSLYDNNISLHLKERLYGLFRDSGYEIISLHTNHQVSDKESQQKLYDILMKF